MHEWKQFRSWFILEIISTGYFKDARSSFKKHNDLKTMHDNWSKSLIDNFSNLSSTLDCSLTLSFRALCTRCRPSKFHVLISFYKREKGKKPTRLSSFTSHGKLSHWVLSWALTFILWRFSALPTSHAAALFRASEEVPLSFNGGDCFHIVQHQKIINAKKDTKTYPFVPLYYHMYDCLNLTEKWNVLFPYL